MSHVSSSIFFSFQHFCKLYEQFAIHTKKKMQCHIVKSRARLVEEGEKPTKCLRHLEFRNFINKTIKRVDDGRTTFHQWFEILNQVNHSMRLYIKIKMQNS